MGWDSMTTSALERAARTQKSFIAGSTKTTIGLTGYFKATLENPAGSGVRVYIDRFAIFATVGNVYGHLYVNPTAGLPTTVKKSNNVSLGAADGTLVVKTDTSSTALSGGTDTGLDIGIAMAVHTEYLLPPFSIAPGTVLGLNVPFLAVCAATMNVTWWEEPV